MAADSFADPVAGALAALRQFHAQVDAAAGDLESRQEPPLRCGRGCADCCVDGLTVFAVEAERIRRDHARLLAEGRPHPPGACAFLDAAGACRIYTSRPYVCRTQGLPLRWLVDDDQAESRDICPLNRGEGRPEPDALAEALCWTIGPWEGRLAMIQLQALGGAFTAELPREALRDLFRAGPAGSRASG